MDMIEQITAWIDKYKTTLTGIWNGCFTLFVFFAMLWEANNKDVYSEIIFMGIFIIFVLKQEPISIKPIKKHKFYEFLEKEIARAHAETRRTQGTLEWSGAKDRENIINEMMREYKKDNDMT